MIFFGGTFLGKVFDSYGPRYLLLGGTLFHVFGLMMVSLSSQYYQFLLAQGGCSAIGASAIFYAANNSIATWFFRRRALAFGIISSGSSLGAVVMPHVSLFSLHLWLHLTAKANYRQHHDRPPHSSRRLRLVHANRRLHDPRSLDPGQPNRQIPPRTPPQPLYHHGIRQTSQRTSLPFHRLGQLSLLLRHLPPLQLHHPSSPSPRHVCPTGQLSPSYSQCRKVFISLYLIISQPRLTTFPASSAAPYLAGTCFRSNPSLCVHHLGRRDMPEIITWLLPL